MELIEDKYQNLLKDHEKLGKENDELAIKLKNAENKVKGCKNW